MLQFGGAVLLARLAPPCEMGSYTTTAAVIGILQAFGLTLFIIREPDLDRHIMAGPPACVKPGPKPV